MSYNLKSLKEQSYSNFRIIAVADDENDESLTLEEKKKLKIFVQY